MLELGQRRDTAAPVTNDKKGPLGSAPPHGSEVGIVRAFVARGYGIPAGYRIGEVHRHGGLDDTALTVEIVPPGEGKPILIRYDEERLCRNPESLRGQAARDTDGLTRGDLIVGKAAQAMYEALCSLAAIYDRTDPRQLTWEWVQELRAACNPLPGFTLERGARYEALQALRQQPYTRGAVQAAQVAQVRDPDYTPALKPRPPVLVVPAAEGRKLHGHFVACGHLGVFVRSRTRCRPAHRLQGRRPGRRDRRRPPPDCRNGAPTAGTRSTLVLVRLPTSRQHRRRRRSRPVTDRLYGCTSVYQPPTRVGIARYARARTPSVHAGTPVQIGVADR